MLTPMRRFLQILRVFSGALLLLVVFVLFAGLALRIALHGREVAIPDLAGLTVAQASEAALHNGLDLNIENKFYSRTVPAGRILSQAPAAGSRVRRGWQVRVTESLGPQQVTIPDVVGEPVREASLDLRKASLDLGTLAHHGCARRHRHGALADTAAGRWRRPAARESAAESTGRGRLGRVRDALVCRNELALREPCGDRAWLARRRAGRDGAGCAARACGETALRPGSSQPRRKSWRARQQRTQPAAAPERLLRCRWCLSGR